MKITKPIILLLVCSTFASAYGISLESGFKNPSESYRPETWFHLIGGNVAKPGLTADLEAIKAAKIAGIQLFHGQFGGPWPGVNPQVACLSPLWDDMIGHVADECQRLGLQFTMQNCPGWAMSGGPWITPDKAMRNLISSHITLQGGEDVTVKLPRPQPSREDWRDYRDIAVIAFPTPAGGDALVLKPSKVISNRSDLPCENLFSGHYNARLRINPEQEPFWVETQFDESVTLRTVELPPIAEFSMHKDFDPGVTIHVQIQKENQWVEVARRQVPSSNWQDDRPLALAIPDTTSSVFRIVFELTRAMELNYISFSSAARINDWQGQGAFVLRRLDRSILPDQSLASWIQAKQIVDLSDKTDQDGTLHWNAPVGDWTVLRFGHVNTGAKNGPAPPEATGFECSKLDKAGADAHFKGYIGRIIGPDGPVSTGHLNGMLLDSWECHTQTWTDAMEKEFSSRRGYPLRKWLPALAGWVIEDHLTSERFLRDWRATINDLLVENYFGRLAELAHENGLKLSFETAIGDVTPGDILQYYSRADIPMCEFWQPNDPQWGGLETKPIMPAASAAHIYGKKVLAAEAFTNIMLRWNEHPFMLKHIADRHFTYGINHLVFHTYTHNPRLDLVPGTSFGAGIGTPFVRGQTWWDSMPLFTTYLARCEYMLQQGNPVADVLWYLGDELDHKPRQDTPFPEGYRFDYVNDDALRNHIEVKDGRLRNKNGTSWRLLWLPTETCQRLTPTTLKRLLELATEGAIIMAAPPKQNASLSGGTDADKQFTSLVHQLWGASVTASGRRHIGAGQILWGSSLKQTLQSLEITPDIVSDGPAAWCHRRLDNTDIYFIAAGRDVPFNGNLGFRSSGKAERWNPLDGTRSPVSVLHRQGEHVYIPMNLPAGGSVFFIFGPKDSKPQPTFTRIDYEGGTLVNAKDMSRLNRSLPVRTQGLVPGQATQPWIDSVFVKCELLDGGQQLLAWNDGEYVLTRQTGRAFRVFVKGTRSINLTGSWNLSFPSGWGAPADLTLPELKPWSQLEHPETRSFSGTAAYEYSVNIRSFEADERAVLDLGRVCNIADVIVNGKAVARQWAAPFRFDITRQLAKGANTITVKVTNTWYNRLAYDASLPVEKKRTWTVSGPGPNSPLEPAGLTGPVKIRIGKIIDLPD